MRNSVLLVEDHVPDLTILMMMIRREETSGRLVKSITVNVARTLAEMRWWLETKAEAGLSYRALVLDLRLPDSPDPRETILQALQLKQDAFVIVFSGLYDEQLANDFYRSGMVDMWIRKDSPREVVEAIAMLLDVDEIENSITMPPVPSVRKPATSADHLVPVDRAASPTALTVYREAVLSSVPPSSKPSRSDYDRLRERVEKVDESLRLTQADIDRTQAEVIRMEAQQREQAKVLRGLPTRHKLDAFSGREKAGIGGSFITAGAGIGAFVWELLQWWLEGKF
ncbi:MAG: hypothetical protein AAF715_28760 [Myxococcota bacterium]